MPTQDARITGLDLLRGLVIFITSGCFGFLYGWCWRQLNWIGMYSLTVFIFHKRIFVHLWGPLLLWWTASQGTILPNSIGLIMVLSATSVLLIYAFPRSGIICQLMGMHQDRDWLRIYGK